ncbi:chemotaxis response regulator protein-glutamate methylesterase [Salicola sp. Rm-C-2C1-2]|uniref:protein-glutamate methylesterase/protein-glutamine glutaminase n=1 Tax=Salicola sp. Rm-C-2C1-2 TaxID=3141321 RepID=UPI0032E4E6CB
MVPIKVLVVDDSAMVRQVLKAIIDQAEGMTCVATARDAYEARDNVNQLAPDVITLDIEMPRMDGLTFLSKLMRARPTPVVMISTLTEKGTEATLRAMELGAVEFIAKPKLAVRSGLSEYGAEIVRAIQSASEARVQSARRAIPPQQGEIDELPALSGTEKIIALGASTGGTEAIKAILEPLPANMPAIVMTQHMPGGFTHSFASRLNATCAMTVKEAEHNERIIPGRAYLAPGDMHMQVIRSGANYVIQLSQDPPVNRHRPSVDVMFLSLVKNAGNNTIALLLTGMGRDGSSGMQSLRETGALTIAQDEDTSLVYGMPKAAVDLGAADTILPLDRMPKFLVDWASRKASTNRV